MPANLRQAIAFLIGFWLALSLLTPLGLAQWERPTEPSATAELQH